MFMSLLHTISRKLDWLKKWAKQKGMAIGHKGLQTFFADAERSKLWQVFKVKRSKSSNPQAKEMFDNLPKDTGGVVKQRELLAKAVFDSDSDAWEEATIKIAKSLIMDRKRKQTNIWLYKGQLEATLGKRRHGDSSGGKI